MTPPVRIKVYGLFSLTRHSYLRQAAIGGASLVLVLFGWWLGWPALRKALEPQEIRRGVKQPELPAWMKLTVRVLDQVPLIVLAAGLYKGIEMWLVLRAFSRQEAIVSQQMATTPTPIAEPKTQATPSSPQ